MGSRLKISWALLSVVLAGGVGCNVSEGGGYSTAGDAADGANLPRAGYAWVKILDAPIPYASNLAGFDGPVLRRYGEAGGLAHPPRVVVAGLVEG